MIIGVTGSFGAGKGAVVEYLVTKKGFLHYSASGFITEEIKIRQMVLDRDSMIQVGNDLREQYGPSYIIEELYKQALQAGGDAVIESLRVVAEVRKIKELGGFVLGVDAPPELRYQRSVARGSAKDQVSFEKWQAQEREESNTTDINKQNIFGALEESDQIISNNGTLSELHQQIESVLEALENRS